jgi:hypothetical protein
LITGVHDTGGKVTTGIVATVANLPPKLLTPAANLTPVPPPVFWIRIRIGILIRIRIHFNWLDPDPHCEFGSGSRRAKMTNKSEENSSFEVLDVR